MESNKASMNPPSKLQPLHFVENQNGIYQGHLSSTQRKEGRGIYLWDSGELYYGSWRNDAMDGHGVFYFALGGYLFGMFSNNKVHGQAALHFPNQDFLMGRWENGLLNGSVIRYFAYNDTWVLCEYRQGSLVRKTKDGRGQPPFDSLGINNPSCMMHFFNDYSDNESTNTETPHFEHIRSDKEHWFQGIISKGKPNGLGIVHMQLKAHRRGIFKDGHLEGPGRIMLSSGDIYDGYLQRGKFHGFGTYYQREKNQWHHGLYEDDVCQQVIKNGNGFPYTIPSALKEKLHANSPNFINSATSPDVLYLADDDTYILEQFLQYPGAGPRSSSRSPTRVLRRNLAAKDNSAPQDATANEINEIVEAQAVMLGQKKPVLISYTKKQADFPTDILSDQFSHAGPPTSEEYIESNHQTPKIRNDSPYLLQIDPLLSQIPETARDNPEHNQTEEDYKDKRSRNLIYEPQRSNNFINPLKAMSDVEIYGDTDDIDPEKEEYRNSPAIMDFLKMKHFGILRP